MILFTSGFPYAGKTKFVQLLLEQVDHAIHINPKDYYMENFEELDDEERMAVGVTAWEISLERTEKCINKLPNEALIVLDTCLAKFNPIQPLIYDAKKAGHDVYCVFVDSDLASRKPRAPEGKNIESYMPRYTEDFIETVPRLKEIADKFMVVANGSGICESELNKQAETLAETIKEAQSK